MAIILDNSGTNNPGGASSSTWSFTNTAGNLIVVGVSAFDATLANRTVSSVIYGGDAMTRIGTDADNSTSNGRTSLFYKLNPKTGANNVVVTMGGSCTNFANYAASFTGINTTDGNNNNTTVGGTSCDAAITTTQANDLIIDVMNGDAGPMSSGSSQNTIMDLNSSTGRGGYRVVTTAGAYSAKYTTAGNDNYAVNSAAFSPSTATATYSALMMMGVG